MARDSPSVPMERGVRVRGIFSTALARLLIDNGIKIVDASPQLKERFGNEVEEKGIALVTIKDRDDRAGLVVIGQKQLAEDVLGILRSVAARSPIVTMVEELYATYVCKVVGPNTVELPGKRRGVLEDGATVGELVTAHVVTFHEGTPVLRRGVALVGEYARLVEGQSHEVSEHIRGVQRSLLLSMAMRAGLEGWGVKWRSSARWAEMSELLDELQSLKEAASREKEKAREATQPIKLTDGELLAFIPLSLEDKVRFDNLRAKQVPTIPLHHLFKACGSRYSNLVDEAENVFLKHCKPEHLSKALMEEVTKEFTAGRLRLLHEKIDGRVAVIEGEYEVLARWPLTLKLVRRARTPGTYDGLEIPKEEGDVILSVATLGSYVLPHAYFSSNGLLKGVYVNINTPIEPRPPNALWYIDLCVDVTYTEERKVRVIDLEELRSYRTYLTDECISYYEKIAAEVAGKLREFEATTADSVLEVFVELSRSYIVDPLNFTLPASSSAASFITQT